ncbi:hypothetical protein [Psychroserpens sp. Hel_I_66]|uniref:hypothetical protein n=1 Tax=Psychroserpens sp. Hel_I_66 TaxID=1250004 RepID=UPI0012E00043|nr:hypothetical protein [Psychroserpens sp. Hel_I_66]
MKSARRSLYELNRNLIIFNAILFLKVYFGMIFLVVLGCFQLISSITIVQEIKSLTTKSKRLFIIYAGTTLSYFVIIFTTDILNLSNDFIPLLFWLIILVSLAFLHLYITYLIQKQ